MALQGMYWTLTLAVDDDPLKPPRRPGAPFPFQISPRFFPAKSPRRLHCQWAVAAFAAETDVRVNSLNPRYLGT